MKKILKCGLRFLTAALALSMFIALPTDVYSATTSNDISYYKSAGHVAVTGGLFNIRSKPNDGGIVIATAKSGDEYKCCGAEQDENNNIWYNIEVSPDTFGWVLGKYCDIFQKINVQDKAFSRYVRVVGCAVNVHSEVGAAYETVGVLDEKNNYVYIGRKRDENGADWYNVMLNETESGWVSSQLCGIVYEKDASPQEALDYIAKKYGAVGVQVALIRNGTVTETYNSGYAVKDKMSMSSEHKIRIASVGKIVLGMATMKMQEEGIVDINSDIGTYWNSKLYKKTTLHQLLSHNSFLNDIIYIDDKNGTLQQLKSAGSYRSSEGWAYNNYGMGIVGSTLEVASERNLNDYLNDEFFDQLDIDASFNACTLKNKDAISELYYPNNSVSRTPEEMLKYKPKAPGSNCSSFAGGLNISAEDMAKLMCVLADNGTYKGKRYLLEESVELMETEVCKGTANGGSFDQCLPLRHQSDIYGQSELYYHTGDAYGTLSFAAYNPVTRDGIVTITTGADRSTGDHGIHSISADIAEYFLNF